MKAKKWITRTLVAPLLVGAIGCEKNIDVVVEPTDFAIEVENPQWYSTDTIVVNQYNSVNFLFSGNYVDAIDLYTGDIGGKGTEVPVGREYRYRSRTVAESADFSTFTFKLSSIKSALYTPKTPQTNGLYNLKYSVQVSDYPQDAIDPTKWVQLFKLRSGITNEAERNETVDMPLAMLKALPADSICFAVMQASSKSEENMMELRDFKAETVDERSFRFKNYKYDKQSVLHSFIKDFRSAYWTQYSPNVTSEAIGGVAKGSPNGKQYRWNLGEFGQSGLDPDISKNFNGIGVRIQTAYNCRVALPLFENQKDPTLPAEAWLFTRKLHRYGVMPDQPISVKNGGQNMVRNYSYAYNYKGIYEVVAVATNVKGGSAKSVVKRLWVIVKDPSETISK